MRIRFIQAIIDKVRQKDKAFLRENTLILPEKFNKSKLNLHIKGKNNTIIIKRDCQIQGCLSIRGFMDDTTIEIGENFRCQNVVFQLGQDHPCFGKIKDVKICIGDNSSWESGALITFNSHTSVIVGRDCMFAGNVMLYNTDAHPVFNYETGTLINKVGSIHIGNHVWLGANSTVLKNSSIADDCILGFGAVYSGIKGGEHPHSVFAGNPARLVKSNVTWNNDGAKFGYIDNDKE